MDLSAIFTDDHIAVMGCFIALTACTLIAAVSFHFGPAGKVSGQGSASLKMGSVQQPDSVSQQNKAA
ncbi:MAG TPA: hypothetical protein EYG03_00045 [Planctomycetes bacterium]|nr:hypothetical protein [Planctomycetota bacterium]